MTPKEKAEALIKSFNKVKIFIDIEPCSIEINIENVDCDANKQCALIAVDEIIEELSENADGEVKSMRIIYWQKVKQEINKL